MRSSSARASATATVGWPPAVGSRVRMADETLGHVVGHVVTDDDGTHVVVREWWKHKQRWEYKVIDEMAWRVGLWKPDASG